MVPPGEATTAASPATTTAGPAATDIVHGVDWFEGDAATAFDYFVLMEILKFFGDLILMAKFEFGSKASLWSTTAPSKYIPAPANGRTDMSRNRFVHVTLVLAGSGGGGTGSIMHFQFMFRLIGSLSLDARSRTLLADGGES
jgi:hypothetical protein